MTKFEDDGSDALRNSGYVRPPRWWVTEDQFEVIRRMAFGNKDEVWRIKKNNN